ncbi:MAG: hypothetical protein AAGF12_01335 [Myxococcota bacterium]
MQLRFVLVSLAVLSAMSSTASAQIVADPESDGPLLAGNRSDKGGRFGLGFEGTLGGTIGLNGRYWISHDVGIQGTVSFGFASGSIEAGMADTDFSSFRLGLGAAAQFRVASWSDGALSAFGGLDFGILTASAGPFDASTVSVGVNGGIHVEWFPADYLSIHGQAGLGFVFTNFSDDDAGNIIGGSRSTVVLDLVGDLYTGFGITFWFG